MAEPLVVFRDVEKRFGDFVAVKRMNFEIYRGEFLALMGPSGCGKTTTLRMLAGLERPSEGDIQLEGKSLLDVKPHERDTPMVWQSLALFPFLNVRQNVEFGLKMRGQDAASRRRKALDWIDRLGIGEFAERDVNSLSGGQRQRVALARALVTEPRILLLDEPLSALDAHLVIRMQSVLTKLQKELGITFLYVTHSQSEAFAMADRVAIMTHGEVAQIGKPRDIYRTPTTRFVAEFVGRNNIFSGTVEIGGTIATPVGRLMVDPSLEAGEQVSFVVAADRMSVAVAPPSRRQRHCRPADLGRIHRFYGDAVFRGGRRHRSQGAGAGAGTRNAAARAGVDGVPFVRTAACTCIEGVTCRGKPPIVHSTMPPRRSRTTWCCRRMRRRCSSSTSRTPISIRPQRATLTAAEQRLLRRLDAVPCADARPGHPAHGGADRLLPAHDIECLFARIACHTADGRDRSLSQKMPGWNNLLLPKGGQPSQIVPQLAPLGDEIVVTKTTDSALTGTNLRLILHNLGIKNVICAGIFTDQCVSSTVRSLADESFNVIVVEDCCAAATSDLHDKELEIINMIYCHVMSAAELTAMIG